MTMTDIGAKHPPAVTPSDPVESCVLWVLEHLGKPMSAAALRAGVARLPGPWTFSEAIEALESLGFRCREKAIPAKGVLDLKHPAIFLSVGGDVGVVTPKNETSLSQWWLPRLSPQPQALTAADLDAVSAETLVEIESDLNINSNKELGHTGRFGHWFFGPLLASKFIYFQVVMAALLTNLFALATSGFSMIVYDRVMPNGAMETLVALLIGVFIIFISDFVIRTLRSYFLDVAGAQADMVIADTLFEQVIDMELAARKFANRFCG